MKGNFSIKHNELRFLELIKNKTPMVINTAGVVFCPFSPFTGILTDELYFIFITKLCFQSVHLHRLLTLPLREE